MSDQRNTLLKNEANTRRSQRVLLRIRVHVRKRTDDEGFLTEVGHTLVVNAHGALLGLSMRVQPNELLVVKNVNSGEERHGRVIGVQEETASQNEVAIEFTEPAPHFWQIDFPPVRWKPA